MTRAELAGALVRLPTWRDLGMDREALAGLFQEVEDWDLSAGLRSFYRGYAAARGKTRYGTGRRGTWRTWRCSRASFPSGRDGEEAVVAAAAMVRADVPPRTVVAGTPARSPRAVRDDELLENWGTTG